MQTEVDIQYFAQFREIAGTSSAKIAIETGDTTASVYLRLAEQHGFPLGLPDIRIAVNDEFTTLDHPLSGGEKIVFIPPVAGG